MAGGEEGGEVGWFFLAGDEFDFDVAEAGGFEPELEGAFLEAEPAIAVEFGGAVEGVAEEVEDEDLAAGQEEAVGGADGGGGVVGVVEGLAEDDHIDAGGFEGWVLEVAEAEFEVVEAVFLGLAGAVGDHFFGVIDGDDAVAAAGEEFAEEAFAGAEVGDGDGGEDAEEEVAEGLPVAAGAVDAVEAAGDLVEIDAVLLLAALEDAAEVDGVGVDFGQFAGALDGELGQCVGGGGGIAAEAVVGAFAVAAGFEEGGFLELAEVGGDSGLAEAGDFLEFVDGEFLVGEEGEDAEAGGVGEGAQGFKDCGHGLEKGC